MTATTTRTGAYRMCGVLVMLAGPGGSAAGQDLLDRVEWCGTEWSWRQRVEAGIERQEAVAGGCPLNGVCDDPSTRNGFIPDGATPIKVIRLRFVIFSNDDGSNPAATLNGVAGQVARMNADFEPHRIQFTYSTAFVDDSTFRQLVLAEEDVMKNLYAVAPESQCNIFVTDLLYGGFVGFGNFPWASDVLTATSGVIIDEAVFGHGEQTMTHEIGHALGLWHTQHGVTEQLPLTCNDDGNPCDCACYEEAAPFNDDVTGDFCVDTPPTPTNFTCAAPGGIDQCSNTAWGPTQPENFMGYAGAPCWSLFTPQQAGRLHCWIEVVLNGWLVTNCPGTGNCYSANGTPGCLDPQCCAAVCAIDPFCCNNQWDAQCANEADTECGPINNDCENASTVAGNLSIPFSTINATTDGPPHGFCQKNGDEQVNQDIWYSYTAPCDGFLTVSMCGTADFDTKLAIYRAGIACPVSDDDLLACEDDAPGCPDFTSELIVQVAGGATYLVRIGGFLNETGSGTISFSCEPHCGSPGTGSCFTAHALPGCDDAGCCQTVCAQDPFCCQQTWDAICVNEAIDLCWNCGPGSGSCWEVNGSPGCGPTSCCATVCTVDPFCCDNTWDQLCADQALALCGPPPTQGACCTGLFSCSINSSAICFILGGTFQGVGTTCQDVDIDCNPLPTGACCLTDGSCGDGFTSVGCLLANGTYQGNGTTCAIAHCDATTGACCFFDDSCTTETETDCDTLGGVFQGVGTLCSKVTCNAFPSGACCFDDGSCTETTSVGCVFLGGTYQGNSSLCSAVACPVDACPGSGSCCVANGTPGCVDEACCDTVCAADPFCCDTSWDSLCVGVAEQTCGALCPVCPWDLDGDGIVGITDFLDLLAAWGPNPGHAADFDGDGIVGITDFLALLGNWGPCV